MNELRHARFVENSSNIFFEVVIIYVQGLWEKRRFAIFVVSSFFVEFFVVNFEMKLRQCYLPSICTYVSGDFENTPKVLVIFVHGILLIHLILFQ